jgi:hypothetical protein
MNQKKERHPFVQEYRIVRLCTVALFAAALSLIPEAMASAQPSPAPRSFLSGKDVVLYPSDPGSSFFRFLPGGATLPFDRSLELWAASGEKCSYLVQTGSAAALASGEAPVISYVIDKRRPHSPESRPGTGLYSAKLAIALSSEEGADIFWALIGPDGSMSAFVRYDAEARPHLEPPSAGSVTYTLVAYAVSASGVRSDLSRFIYRLTEPGLPAASPIEDKILLSPDPSIASPKLESGRGYARLSMVLPPGSSLLLAFDRGSAPSSLEEFERIEADESGLASFRIDCPYAWSGEASLYYGVLKGNSASYSPMKLSVQLAYPADEVPLPSAPSSPFLDSDLAGRTAFLSFPAYDGDIYVSIGNAESKLYTSPIVLPTGLAAVTVSWYGQDVFGKHSPSKSRSFELPVRIPDVELTGVASLSSVGSEVVLKAIQKTEAPASAKAQVRYELRTDGGLPPEPSSSSPLLGDSLSISCPAGEERSVVIRYRCFVGDAGGEGSLLRFTLDKKPPEPPVFAETPSAYSDKSASIRLLPGSGGKDVFASVATEDSASPFALVTGPIQLTGSDSGPVDYTIRAYDVDAAGNRSKDMPAFSLVVDRASVYAAEDGSDRGDGSPDRPYKNLDAAFAAASRGGKKSVNLRGTFTMRSPARFSSEISLVGGFGPAWAKDPEARAVVRVLSQQGKAVITQNGGSLSIRRIELDAEGASSPLIALSSASLFVSESAIVAWSEGDLIIVSASRSKIALSSSRIEGAAAMSLTAFSAEGSDIVIADSSVSSRSDVRIFGAFDMDGGSLSVRESLLASASDLGLNLLSLRSSSLSVDRSLIQVEGGTGFLRIGSLKAVSGEIKNSKLFLSWKGPGTLFEIQGGGPAFRHNTVVADSKASLRFFDIRGSLPHLWNSIFDCSAPDSEFLRSDSVPAAGIVVADCVWGFDSYLEGELESKDFSSLNTLNALSALYSSKPCVSESPEDSFSTPLKSQAQLKRGSACVDAALPIEFGYSLDFSGHQRPAPGTVLPDIGADELGD